MGRLRGYFWLKPVVKTIIGLLVVLAVTRHAWGTWTDLRARGALPRFDPVWGIVALGLYLAGLVVYGLYFVMVLRAGVSPVGTFAGVRAYLISHLGKYVPGKALVVVMRVGMVTPYGARASTAAFATFYETLVMMAVGGLIAACVLPFSATVALPGWLGRTGKAVPLGLIGLMVGLGFFLLTSPRVFPRVAAMVGKRLPDVGADAVPRVNLNLFARGWVLTLVGWILLGLSQVAVIRALGLVSVPVSMWPVVVGCVAMATVAGFAVPISPGGLGVREFVLWTGLGSILDQDLAVIASLALRMVWVVGEVLAAVILLAARPSPLAVPAQGQAVAEVGASSS